MSDVVQHHPECVRFHNDRQQYMTHHLGKLLEHLEEAEPFARCLEGELPAGLLDSKWLESYIEALRNMRKP